MSIRHEYSYWLTAKPVSGVLDDSADELYEALQAHNIAAPNGPLHVEVDVCEACISGEVNPDAGTVEEDRALLENLKTVAKKFPQYNFELDELDEEDHSIGVKTIISGGEVIETRQIRVVDLESKYDTVTVKTIADYLDKNGYHTLSEVILENFAE